MVVVSLATTVVSTTSIEKIMFEASEILLCMRVHLLSLRDNISRHEHKFRLLLRKVMSEVQC
jgi:hypothetical protein